MELAYIAKSALMEKLLKMEVGDELVINHQLFACYGTASKCPLGVYSYRLRERMGWRLSIKHFKIGVASVVRLA